MTPSPARSRLTSWPWLHAMRPAQWLKNGVVLAAYFFAYWDPTQQAHAQGWRPLLTIILAAASFCAVASGIYLLNDLRDIDADRLHPIKRLRPLAAGTLKPRAAWILAAALLVAGVGLLPAVQLGHPSFTLLLVGYIVMQLAYTLVLKRVTYVDVFIIAIGFVLRAVAGALVLAVRISPWLLLCTFLLALFLALCKRRHEKIILTQHAAQHRAALNQYDRHLLDLQIAITASATVVCYALYTLSEETVARFQTDRLGLTIPLVLFGLFRYLELVYTAGEGGQPEKVLLSDKVLILTIFLYVLATIAIFLTVKH